MKLFCNLMTIIFKIWREINLFGITLKWCSPPYFLSEGVMSSPSSKSKKSYINIIIIIFFIRVTCSNINVPTGRLWVRMLARLSKGWRLLHCGQEACLRSWRIRKDLALGRTYMHTFPDVQKVNHSNIYVVVNFLFQLIFVFSLFQIN